MTEITINTPPFIQSVHRPFNESLKTTKWVCEFVDRRGRKVEEGSNFNIEFFLYIVTFLHRAYGKHTLQDYNGIPSKEAVKAVYDELRELSKEDKIRLIQQTLRKERTRSVEKQIYSTYKASTYFVNFAKEKLKLITTANELSSDGRQLLTLRGPVFDISEHERLFYFRKIVEVDFLLFVSLCLFIRISEKYSFNDYVNTHFSFLEEFYSIRHFDFTSSSLNNYNTVRLHWIKILGVLDSKMRIKKKFVQIMEQNPLISHWFSELQGKMSDFERVRFREIRRKSTNIHRMEQIYSKLLRAGKADLGFVNLYDIKEEMRISHDRFEELLNTYYEQEKSKRHIFFSNIVNSIDRRQRFNIRKVPVIKIKISL